MFELILFSFYNNYIDRYIHINFDIILFIAIHYFLEEILGIICFKNIKLCYIKQLL